MSTTMTCYQKHQSAYRQYHSCESALLRLAHDLLGAMEQQQVTALIAIDLSAAFDTVDHGILLDVIQKQYGVSGNALGWGTSYLTDRTCRVSVNNALSSVRELDCSVPQGSCLGPWLFLTYAGTLFDVIPEPISLFGFADDRIAFRTFEPTSHENELESIHDLENCGILINNWMKENKLKMNTSKTEFIMFGSRQQLNKCSTKEINIIDDRIQSARYVRYLGAYLDETLNLKVHIKTKCRAAMLNYLRIKSIRKYLTKNATETLVLSLVISHLDYCNAILYGVAETDISKMQRIQNMCAKLVLNRGKYESSRQALYDLHWLPIKARINQKLLTFMFQCFIGRAPEYLNDILSKQVSRRQGLRSEIVANFDYQIPLNKRKTFSDRSFGTVGPRLWNALPLFLKQSETLDVFKRRLKTHYFSDFFSLF